MLTANGMHAAPCHAERRGVGAKSVRVPLGQRHAYSAYLVVVATKHRRRTDLLSTVTNRLSVLGLPLSDMYGTRSQTVSVGGPKLYAGQGLHARLCRACRQQWSAREWES